MVDKSRIKLYLYGLAPTLGGLSFGYDTGSMSGILAMEQFANYFNHPSNSVQGGLTASIQIGSMTGSLLTGIFLADRLGRRRSIICGATLFTIAIAICTAANNMYCLIAGRVLNGIANGCCTMMVPLWQSEVMPKSIRGRIISLQQMAINFGILCAYLIQYGCSYIDGQAAWRLPLGIQMVPTISLAIMMFFMPDSPRWLVKKGRVDEARRALAQVQTGGDLHDPLIDSEMDEIEATLAAESLMEKPSYFQILFSKRYGRRTLVGIGAQWWQQLTGINSIMYYAPFLFQQVGVSGTQASLLSNVIQCVILNVLTAPSMLFLDVWGRRAPMIWGALAMAIFMMLIGVILPTLGNPHMDSFTNKVNFTFESEAPGKACIAFVYLYVAAFAITWASPAWVVPAEIFDMATRGRATSITGATNFFVNFWLALYLPTALEKISYGVYIMFAALNLLAAISVFLFQPETANRSLEEMSYMFEPDKTMWVFRDKELTEVHPSFSHRFTVTDVVTQKADDVQVEYDA